MRHEAGVCGSGGEGVCDTTLIPLCLNDIGRFHCFTLFLMCHNTTLYQCFGFSFNDATILETLFYNGSALLLSAQCGSAGFTRWRGCTCRAWAVTRCCRALPWQSRWAPPRQTLTGRSPSTPPPLRSLSPCVKWQSNIDFP